MKPIFTLSFKSGHVYAVITQALADLYVQKRTANGEHTAEVAKAEAEEIFSDDQNLIGWVLTNTTWAELAPFARLIDFKTIPLSEQFSDALIAVPADPVHIAQLRGETLLAQPIEMLLSVMAADNASVNSIIVDGTSGHQIAFVTVRGPESVVGGYLEMISAFTEGVRKQAEAIPVDVEAKEVTAETPATPA